MTDPRVVTLDIERQSAICGGIWQLKQRGYLSPRQIIVPVRTICFAWKWLGEDEIHFSAEWDPHDTGEVIQPHPYRDTGLLEDYHVGHHQMMEHARDVLHEADFVIGWNSKAFDIKNLRVHLADRDITPASPHVDVDLIKTSRSEFGFMSHTLVEAAAHFGLGSKYELPPGLWDKLRWCRDPEALAVFRDQMRDYNKRDVELTEQVFEKMRPWIPRLNLYGDPEAQESELDGDLRCRRCDSRNVTKEGVRRFTTYWYHRLWCKDCHGWSHTTKSYYHMENASS